MKTFNFFFLVFKLLFLAWLYRPVQNDASESGFLASFLVSGVWCSIILGECDVHSGLLEVIVTRWALGLDDLKFSIYWDDWTMLVFILHCFSGVKPTSRCRGEFHSVDGVSAFLQVLLTRPGLSQVFASEFTSCFCLCFFCDAFLWLSHNITIKNQ